MNVDHAAFRDLVSTKAERRVADSLNNSFVITVEKISMDAIEMATNFVAVQKHSAFNGLIVALISRKDENERPGS